MYNFIILFRGADKYMTGKSSWETECPPNIEKALDGQNDALRFLCTDAGRVGEL